MCFQPHQRAVLKICHFSWMGEFWLPICVSKFHDNLSRKIHRVNGSGLLWQINSFSTQHRFNVLFVLLSLQFPFPYGVNIFSSKQKYVHINIWLRFSHNVLPWHLLNCCSITDFPYLQCQWMLGEFFLAFNKMVLLN